MKIFKQWKEMKSPEKRPTYIFLNGSINIGALGKK